MPVTMLPPAPPPPPPPCWAPPPPPPQPATPSRLAPTRPAPLIFRKSLRLIRTAPSDFSGWALSALMDMLLSGFGTRRTRDLPDPRSHQGIRTQPGFGCLALPSPMLGQYKPTLASG